MAFSAVALGFQPRDQKGLLSWLFDHAMEHRLFRTTLLSQTPAVPTTDYPLEVMGDGDGRKQWAAAHQAVSQAVWTGIGGGQSVDFTIIAWDDDDALQSWMDTHAAWHNSVRDSLGL